MATRGELTVVMSMRMSEDDDRLLKSVAAQVQIVPKLVLARIAMRLGLLLMQKDPMGVLKKYGNGETPKRRK